SFYLFFFQAEDGIRDFHVTGVQTCALPIYQNPFFCTYRKSKTLFPHLPNHKLPTVSQYLGFHLESHHNALADAEACAHIALQVRSEERRVGKECRSRWEPYSEHNKRMEGDA